MDIAILLYDQFTATDCVGPYDVLQLMPDTTVTFVGTEARPYRTDMGQLAILADKTIADVPNPDMVLIPGGIGTRPVMKDRAVVEWVQQANESAQYMTSVCTGSLLLGAAGLLDGLTATTHWGAVDTLNSTGATYVAERFVDHGRIITAAGVSAGIDMALHLAAQIHSDDVAKAIQLAIEYDPQPPFDAGTPEKAGPELAEFVNALFASQVDSRGVGRGFATRARGKQWRYEPHDAQAN